MNEIKSIEILGKYKDYKLCFVDRFTDGLAWFSDCEPIQVWGDDFNDAPYEHNCGQPYYDFTDESGVKHEVDFALLHFASNYETPAQHANGNSRYSVEMINHKFVAWLSADSYSEDITKYPPVFAGTTVQEFCDTILETGGMIYVPVWMLDSVKAMREVAKNEIPT